MKILYIVRHASSQVSELGVADKDRPLIATGEQEILQIGKRLNQQHVIIDKIIASTALRAKQTAQQFSDVLHDANNNIEYNEKIYHADVEAIFNIVGQVSNQYHHLMIVGHNPTMSSFAETLMDNAIGQLATASICAVQLNIDDWQALYPGCGECLFIENPH